ncbi:3-deoxy-D-manno-octulosonic acid transferase [Rhodovulum sp. BSW8]|uniref:3-deoxy-D-manno-octulosonic acid transferase n=1 Tax=Rhodovulum sp. BSW8 TaxID=2259645 RepID=UPI000DE254D0|nr:glycosyltransferase N-terminal domain-containing protein [Rhodovulum sp. BSW8]RBO53648.1 3-deoxy-D-manno-octulosonic acid transferase [Rhodovulum sp. BSW8]
MTATAPASMAMTGADSGPERARTPDPEAGSGAGARRIHAGPGAEADSGTAAAGPLLWLHNPPPDEQAAAVELIRELALEKPALRVLVTGIDAPPLWVDAARGLPQANGTVAPADGHRAVSAFLELWRPDLAVFYPDHLPSTLISLTHARGTALFLITRDLPRAWHSRWRVGIGGTRRLLRRFDRIFAQSPGTAGELRALGLPRWQISPCGPLSEGSAVLGCSEAERDVLAGLMGGRPAWLAAGVPAAEEPVVIAAHAAATRFAHRLLMILAPEDPARGPALAAGLREDGWDVALRSDDEEPSAETQIYVADTEGELGLWLRLAPVTFLGGTLGANTGPDPYRAAALGSAILHGPATGAYPDHYRRLSNALATRTVQDARSMAEVLVDVLAPDRAAAMARAAWEVSTQGTMATERVVRRMIEALDIAEAV